ncbi:MAG TPA: phosphoribosylglycinamide formyltransferase [bacterium]|nr:phosphoribosylglycinamide formyltransferase [bacterium]
MDTGKKKVAVLLSGSGTTFQYIQDCIKNGDLDAEIVVVVSSRPDAYGIDRAKADNIPVFTVPRKEFNKFDSDAGVLFNRKIMEVIEPYEPDLVVLAGFMSLLSSEFVQQYPGRIMNTHPALIPCFCGEGYYGDKVHKAVVDRGVKISGCTIHFVDEHYDHGPIILQKPVEIEDTDTSSDVAGKVQAIEKPLYVEAIRLFCEGRLEIRGRKVFVKK